MSLGNDESYVISRAAHAAIDAALADMWSLGRKDEREDYMPDLTSIRNAAFKEAAQIARDFAGLMEAPARGWLLAVADMIEAKIKS